MNKSLARYSNLQQRIIAGVIGGGAILGAIWYSRWSFVAMFTFICGLTLYEFYTLLEKSNIKSSKLYGTVSGTAIFLIFFLVEELHMNTLLFLIFPIMFTLFLVELFQQNEDPFKKIAWTFLGIVYIAFPMGLLCTSSFPSGVYNPTIILGILFLIWANDIGAYASGLSFGKHKLFERVSPKKTWEGSIGGAITTLLISWLLATWFNSMEIYSQHGLSLIEWLGLAIIVVFFGSTGDLVESLLKRNLGVKDSGNMIPGHGGFLDRFDALIFAAPFIAAYLKLACA
jgi:phosphatidate cytidylyltransferase